MLVVSLEESSDSDVEVVVVVMELEWLSLESEELEVVDEPRIRLTSSLKRVSGYMSIAYGCKLVRGSSNASDEQQEQRLESVYKRLLCNRQASLTFFCLHDEQCLEDVKQQTGFVTGIYLLEVDVYISKYFEISTTGTCERIMRWLWIRQIDSKSNRSHISRLLILLTAITRSGSKNRHIVFKHDPRISDTNKEGLEQVQI